MSREVLILLAVVVPDEPDNLTPALAGLIGRELPGLAGSWVTRTRLVAPRAHRVVERTGSSPVSAAGLAVAAALDELERDAEVDRDFGLSDTDS